MHSNPSVEFEKQRCPWCGKDPLYVQYHDEVWGVPEYDDKALFAKLILDGAQAGLSWITILRRQEGYFQAFDGLDPEIMAFYNEADKQRLLLDPRIIRNRAKIDAAIGNARAFINMQQKGISFSDFLWSHVDGRPLRNTFKSMAEMTAETPLSQQLSKTLKKEGFRFVGPTIVYAFMQAVGMVNDHLTECFRHTEINEKHGNHS